MSHLFRPSYTKTDPTTGEKVRRQVNKWYGRYLDADGREQRVPLCEDKSAAQTMLAELIRQVDRVRAGLVDPVEEHLQATIESQLKDYRQSLEVKGRAEKHVTDTIHMLRRISADCRFRILSELQRGKVAIEAYLAERLDAKLSRRTVNADLIAIRAFCRWLLSHKRIQVDPTLGLKRLNESEDRRYLRRALTEAEAESLLATTLHSERTFRDLTGLDRWLLYLVALNTGLRRNELVSLTPKSFDFSGETSIVKVEAKRSKRRKLDTLPLPPGVAAVIRAALATKPLDQPIWPGTWWERSSKMFKEDLAEAKISSIDADGQVLDFHGQRTTFVTNLSRAGVTPAIAQKLARHSDINLTMGVYTRLSIEELARAVATLPQFGSAPSQVPDATSVAVAESPLDARLAKVCLAWPNLTEPIRQAILALLTVNCEPKAVRPETGD